MKKIFLLIALLYASQPMYAQQTVESIRKQATASVQQQDFTGAIQILEQGLQQYPDNLEILKDEAYIAYISRDYERAVKIGKSITERQDADEQSFQILGLAYKAIASYKDADKMYKAAIKKFPKSGVLYSEYGDMFTQYGNKREAINQWEKGISAGPAYSGNYYYACKYYADNNNIFWSNIYGEIFVNIETLTKRTTEIKAVLLKNYKSLFGSTANIEALKKDGNDFEKAVASSMLAAMESESGDISPEIITAFRARFLLNWAHTNAANYPYKLFDLQLQLMRDGMFDAYNQWLFGQAINKNKYDNWVYTHDEEMQRFTQYQRNVLFKMPPEQYYGRM
ncbi:tetratricopeptide repeat protein [Parafilimonas sp.]|uniref:tetratricopeptide repeat protein n=1 Tax=Parafilimonas sp. TaxID=1969739 RepID=UPI0039E44EFC